MFRRLLQHESDDIWLPTGVRAFVLLTTGWIVLLTGAIIENSLTGDVSLITRLSWLGLLLVSIPTAVIALVCTATGLTRRFLLNRVRR